MTDAHESAPSQGLAASAAPRYSHSQLRRSRDLLSKIYATRRVASFYPSDHPAVPDAIAELFAVVSAYHVEGVDVQLGFFEDEVLLGEQLLTDESVLFDQLVRDMLALGIGSLVISRGTTLEELTRAMQVLAFDESSLAAEGGLDAVLGRLELKNVAIGGLGSVDRARRDDETLEDAKVAYDNAIAVLREAARVAVEGRTAGPSMVKGSVRSLVDNVLASRHAMLKLAGLKNHDEYTFYHSVNVAVLSISLGSMITTEYRFLSSLGTGALLHDTGKLSLDNEILNKQGPLTAEEWELVRQHPVEGAEMIALTPGVDRSAIVTVLEHHMRYDGSGYPPRNPTRRQHLASRIVAIADSYDAMTSRRSYSAARVQDEAMEQLAQCAGTALDPALLRLFVRMMGAYPARSVVRLSSGEVGVVVRANESDPLRPVVRIVASADGGLVSPFDVDLTSSSDVSVQGTLDARQLNIDIETFFN